MSSRGVLYCIWGCRLGCMYVCTRCQISQSNFRLCSYRHLSCSYQFLILMDAPRILFRRPHTFHNNSSPESTLVCVQSLFFLPPWPVISLPFDSFIPAGNFRYAWVTPIQMRALPLPSMSNGWPLQFGFPYSFTLGIEKTANEKKREVNFTAAILTQYPPMVWPTVHILSVSQHPLYI